jgi:peroxiredoxin
MPEDKPAGTAKKIETAANIAILLVACLVVVFFIRNYRAEKAGQPHAITVGTQFALKDIHWEAGRKNIVLALSTTCHYCSESAGFYRQLVKECQARGVRTIAVLPQTVSEGQSYLSGNGFKVDEVRQSFLPDLEITVTPTLLLVDGQGKIERVWYGKLPPEKEKEVLAKL